MICFQQPCLSAHMPCQRRFTEACFVSGGLGVAGDRLQIGGLGVVSGDFRQRARKGPIQNRVWQVGTTTQIKDGTKSSVTKTKLIEGYMYSRWCPSSTGKARLNNRAFNSYKVLRHACSPSQRGASMRHPGVALGRSSRGTGTLGGDLPNPRRGEPGAR